MITNLFNIRNNGGTMHGQRRDSPNLFFFGIYYIYINIYIYIYLNYIYILFILNLYYGNYNKR